MSEKFTYKTRGICSDRIELRVNNNIIEDCAIIGGCPGNTTAVAKLVIGHDVDEIINMLDGTRCGFKATSCPDQLAKALRSYKASL